ncbi:MAG TPA: cobyrinate a,c-diamide synthase, partial [Nitrospinota bacterium]|nr:cobyrinate a,c-diamide synthase [Nitrospinota bacterium]
MKKPLFIIAGTNSGCGKTTVTLGIIHSLVKKKLKTSAFKIGPDYIDPSYHKAITAKPGCNLDSWMM